MGPLPVAVPSRARPMALAVGTMAACALPLFFTSALAADIQRDLALRTEQIGIAITAFWVVATLGSLPGGRLVDRIGAARGVRLAGALVALGSLGIATLADSFTTFVPLLCLTGLGNAFVTPAISSVVSGGLGADRRGTTFGLQQSGPPLASVVAGLALPTAAAALGWRWVFALGAVAVAGATGIVRERDARPAATATRPDAAPVPSLARPAPPGGSAALPIVGATLASGVANGLIAYVVVFALDSGLSSPAAGILLAAASITCVGTRIVLGVLADRRPRPRLRQMASLVLVGVPGFALLSTQSPSTVVVGCLLALGIGWGWAGLYVLSAVEREPHSPGRAVGAAATGTFGGAMIGPIFVGLLAGATSFQVTWLACAALSLLSAAALLGAPDAGAPA